MASPIPPDPYVALGVAKDADLSTIRTAHRKLVLKYHPDRIKDEALKEKGKDEFQKIQQAYELLIDSNCRQRYDDRIKLAELRKEKMMREGSTRSTTHPTRHDPTPSRPPPREYRDDGIYEERVPNGGASASYFDPRDRYDEPPRASARKYPGDHERKSAPSRPVEKEKKPAASSMKASAFVAAGLRRHAEKAKTKVKENRAAEKEARDKEKRRDREEKHQTRRSAYVSDDDDSDSDIQSRFTSTARPSKTTPRSKRDPEPASKKYPGAQRPRDDDADSSDYDPKWERIHESSIHYIDKASRRPGLDRRESDAYNYWEPGNRPSGRRSGSDNEKRPASSKGRHFYEDVPPRPSMPTQNSAPSNLRPHLEERVPSSHHRSTSGSYPVREKDHRKEVPPSFQRSQTMPSPRSTSKRDNAPSKASNLRQSETHDSGYGSGPSPHTPEIREESPERPSRPKPQTHKSTRYQIVDPEKEDDYRHRIKVLDDDLDRPRRYASPEPDHERRREKSERPRVESHTRTRSSRDAPSMPDLPSHPSMRRAESGRYEQRSSRESPRDSPPLSRNNSGRDKSFTENTAGSDPRYARAYEKVSTTPNYNNTSAKFSTYRSPNEQRSHDYSYGSHFQESIRNPDSRRPSVY